MMDTKNIIIRLEREEEYREVENMVREIFWNVYLSLIQISEPTRPY